MKTIFVLFFLCAHLAVSFANLSPRQCVGDPNAPTPISLTVAGCSAEPCTAVNGADITFAMNFNTPRATNTLTAAAAAFLLDLPLPYDVPEEKRNACEVGLMNAACPLSAGQNIQYQLSGVPVEAPISGVTISLEFSLTDDSRNFAICTRLDFRIVAP